MAAVRIRVLADPKTGYKPPADRSEYFSSSPDQSSPYAIVDYDRLDQIVVWAEPMFPQTRADEAPRLLEVRLTGRPAAAMPPITLARQGQPIAFSNDSKVPIALFGRWADLTRSLVFLEPGKIAGTSLELSGLLEIVADTSDLPIARFYIAPKNSVAILAVSGKPVDLTPLTPGKYRITCWHPRLPGSSQEIDIPADKLTQITLTVSVNNLSKSATAP
jgi:hypothetical protein